MLAITISSFVSFCILITIHTAKVCTPVLFLAVHSLDSLDSACVILCHNGEAWATLSYSALDMQQKQGHEKESSVGIPSIYPGGYAYYSRGGDCKQMVKHSQRLFCSHIWLWKVFVSCPQGARRKPMRVTSVHGSKAMEIQCPQTWQCQG